MAPVMVLFYHRIADDAGSPWTMSNREFAAQMHWLQRRFDMVSLDEAQLPAGRQEESQAGGAYHIRRRLRRELRRGAAAIDFAENSLHLFREQPVRA